MNSNGFITVTGADKLAQRIMTYAKTFKDKNTVFLKRLADLGIQTADIHFNSVTYDGDKDVNTLIEWVSDTKLRVVARGKSVLFIEFGTGITYSGYKHPMASQFGYGPSTWSLGPEGKGRWDNYYGWYYAKGKRSYGNPPARAMYEASKTMRDKITQIAKEVYST